MALIIQAPESDYALRVPAHRYWQGGREVYSFALDLATLDGILPQRVDEDMVKDANRRLTPSHAKKIKDYLAEKPDWLLGSLLLGIAPQAVEFHPYQDRDGKADGRFGELRILSKHKNTMKIFDGQHRRRAIEDLLSETDGDERRADLREKLLQSSLPIVLYAEQDVKALRRMFVDASQTKAIEKNAVTQFDDRDAFNIAAMNVAANSDLFAGRVEMKRTTVSRTSRCLIAINQLAATLKTLDVGYKGRVSKARNDEHMLDPDGLLERSLIWADGFLPTAREEYERLLAGEIDNSEIPTERQATFAYNATVIRILAGCYYEWTKDGSDWKPLAEFVRSANLTPGQGSGALLVDAGVVAHHGVTPLPRIQEVTRAIDFIVKTARDAAIC